MSATKSRMKRFLWSMDPANARVGVGAAAWVHAWEFDEENRVVREISCDGASHLFAAQEDRKVASWNWSALKDHGHAHSAGWLGQFEKRREQRSA